MIKFEKKSFSDEDIDDFIDSSKSEYLRTPGMKDSKFIKWKFILNPKGKSNYFYFKVKEDIAGRILSAHYPGSLVIENFFLSSFCLSDLFIKKEHRQLSHLKSLYNKCLDETDGVIFHSSNENSEKFYTKILQKKIFFNLISCGIPLSFKPFKKYQIFGRLFYLIFVKLFISHIFFLNKILKLFKNPNIEYYDNIFFDDDIRDLRDQNLKNGECFFFKDKNFFKWRYEVYNNVHFLKIFRSKKFIGYISLIESEVLNLKNMILLDFQFTRELSFLDKIKIKLKIIEISLKRKCDTLYSMGNQNNYMYKNILGYPFFKLPDSILPHANPMFIHNIPSEHSEKMKNINFTISDFDYF